MRPAASGPVRVVSARDAEKARGVRRMKLVAGGLLALATVLYVAGLWAEHAGAGGWSGYLQAAAEAGMVGALADWFAVTALFRRPLGLPIPHTAIIPTRKDAFGENLAEFLGDNFLAEDVVRRRLAGVDVAGRVGAWLAVPANAERATAQVADLGKATLAILRDDDIRQVFGEALTRRVSAQAVAEPLGALLERVVADGAHHGLVDLVVERAHEWLVEHRDAVLRVVVEESPEWSPAFLDRTIANRVHRELVRFAAAVRADPRHPARLSLDAFLSDVARDLQRDPAMIRQVEQLRDRTLAHPRVQELVTAVWTQVRGMLLEAIEDQDGALRARARDGLRGLGRRLVADARLRGKVDAWVDDAVSYVVTTYRGEITALVTETVRSWDATETSRKIELNVGRDLQFIRINGTVVGALAGLVIHTLTQLAT